MTNDHHLATSDGADEMRLLRDREIKFVRQVIEFDDIDADASTRNQARLLPVHQETIEIYRAAMTAGDRFPPIVVDATKKPYVILDGNHRMFAAKMAGFSSTDALLVKTATKAQMELFTYESNAKHGLPTTLEERVKQGMYLVSIGNQPITVAKALSIPERKLYAAIANDRINKRLVRIGINDPNKIMLSHRQRLSAIRSDAVLAPMVDIVAKAKLGTEDVSDIVTKLNTISGEASQLEYVAQVREKYEPLIATTAGGALDLPPDVVRLRMAARLLRNIDEGSLQGSIDRTAPEFRSVIAREVVESVSALLTASKILSDHAQS